LPGGGIASHRVTTGEVALLLFLMACVYHSLKTGLRVYRNLTGGFDRWTDMPKLKKSSSMVLAVAVSALLIFVAWCGVTTVAKLL
jgi:succinate dehydrogenase/fumarate reductase cytochrome b subunit